MEFSCNLRRHLSRAFTIYEEDHSFIEHGGGYHGISKSLVLSLNDNNIFNKYLVTKIDCDEIEIPVIVRSHVEKIIHNNIQSEVLKYRSAVLPLFVNSLPYRIRTFDCLLGVFSETTYNSRLSKVLLNNGETYYGGRGLILDSNSTPLILCTLKARKVKIGGVPIMAYLEPIIHVNPVVFSEPSKFVNKNIIKKIIPFYTTTEVPIIAPRNISFLYDPKFSTKAVVIVKDMSKFFAEPTIPKPQSCSSESLNEWLVNNIDDILQSYGYR